MSYDEDEKVSGEFDVDDAPIEDEMPVEDMSEFEDDDPDNRYH